MTFNQAKYDQAKIRRLWNPVLWDQVRYRTICKNLSGYVDYGEINKHTIDVGGNTGYQTVWHAQYNPVISYEAVPDLCEILKSNIRNRTNYPVEVRNKAVGNIKGEVDFYVDANRMSMSSQIPLVDNVKKITVPMVRLDDDIEDYTKIGFIKIDVEGFELSVLEGAEMLIESAKPTMMVEIYKPWCDKTGIPIRKYFEWFDERGYKAHYYSCTQDKMLNVIDIDDGVESVEKKHKEHDGDFLFVGK